MKIWVRVKTPSGEYLKKKEIESDGKTIIMERTKDGVPSWYFTISNNSIYYAKTLFGRRLCCDVIHGARKAVEYDYDSKKADAPTLTMSEMKRLLELPILIKRYAHVPKPSFGWVNWLVIALVIINIIITMWATGRLHIG